jgi:hypothetical protein
VKPEVLKEKLAAYGVTAKATGSVAAGIETALAGAGKNGLICAAGSIFVIAEVVENY